MRAVDQQALFQGFGNVRSALDIQIDADHQAFAANFANKIEISRLACPGPLSSSAPRARTLARQLSLRRYSGTQPVAQVSGPPPNVDAVQAGRRAATASGARNAPSGRPAGERFCDEQCRADLSSRW